MNEREKAYRNIANLCRMQWSIIILLVIAIVILLIGQATAGTPAETVEDVATKYPVEIVELESMGDFTATAYCACVKCCGKDPNHPAYGITASGARATAGRTIAVDPNIIPMGSKVFINGHEYTAEDTGGVIKGARVDIYFDSHGDALEWGVQTVEVFREVGA